MKLEGKVAIVTGAASGIGRSTAMLFAKEGARVTIVDKNMKGGKEIAMIIGENGGQAIFSYADVSKPDDVKKMVELTLEKFDRINILVNNAAYMLAGAPVVELPEAEWYECINVTLTSQYLCSKHVIPEMIKVGGGTIVNVSSIGSLVAFQGNPAYCSAKGGVNMLTKAMAVDYASHNIRVNALCPGAVDTPGAEPFKIDQVNYENTLDLISIKRWARPDEMSKVILFLASDDSSYMTGSIIVADGGWILR